MLEINIADPQFTSRPTHGRRHKIEILDSFDDVVNATVDLRVRVDKTTIKHVAMEYDYCIAREQDKDTMAHGLARIWRDGDWDKAHIEVTETPPGDVEYEFKTLIWSEAASFREVNGHNLRVIDSDSLAHVDKLSKCVRVVTCAAFPRRPLIYKFAAFPRDEPWIQTETKIYGLLGQNADKHDGIAPIFVAHVHHDGQIIGFLLEYIPGFSLSFPLRYHSQYKACHKALKQLHALGIGHRFLQGDSFFYRGNAPDTNKKSEVVFLGLGGSMWGVSKTELEGDLSKLEKNVTDNLKAELKAELAENDREGADETDEAED